MNEELSNILDRPLLVPLSSPVLEDVYAVGTSILDIGKVKVGTMTLNGHVRNRLTTIPDHYKNFDSYSYCAQAEVENNYHNARDAIEATDYLYPIHCTDMDKNRNMEKLSETLFDFGSFELDAEERRPNCDEFIDISYQVSSDLPKTDEAHQELVQNNSTSIASSSTVEKIASCSDLADSETLNEDEHSSNMIVKVKKRRKRVKNPGPYPNPLLPPCIICNEKASGFHYGANTCEACKGFFRRTLKKDERRLKCKCEPGMQEEWNRGPIKNGCSSCRFKRCLKEGMSREAIKIGRYTIKHKTENIIQIKSAEAVDRMIDETMAKESENSPSSTSVFCENVSVISPSSTSGSEFHIKPLDDDTNSKLFVSSFSESELCYFPSEAKMAYTFRNVLMSSEEIDSIVDRLTEAQTKSNFVETRDIPAEVIRQKQTEYLEKYNLKKQMFGDMILSADEFKEFYKITGIDLDGRIQHMTGVFNYFERKISKLVEFAKSIPEFKRLTLNDQADLIKASRVESSLLGGYKDRHRNFDLERRIVTTPWGKEIHLDELAKIHPLDGILSLHEHCQILVNMKLTEKEDSVLREIVIMFTDRCKLEEPHKVEQIQGKLISCLEYLLNIRSDGSFASLYCKIFSFLTNLRDFTEDHQKFRYSLLREYPMLSTNRYQLLKEFMS